MECVDREACSSPSAHLPHRSWACPVISVYFSKPHTCFYVLCAVLSALQIPTHLILTHIVGDGLHGPDTFTDKETEAQKVK